MREQALLLEEGKLARGQALLAEYSCFQIWTPLKLKMEQVIVAPYL